MLYFLQGLTLGFAYVAPIGVQNLFVINTGLTQPRARAYQTALIIIFFDISLALACFFGIGALMEAFPPVKMAVLLIGSLVVFYMGVQLIRAEPTLGQGRDVQVPLGKVVGIACVVTWFNPQALIDGTLLLGAFRATLPPTGSTAFILGVAAASAAWFLIVATVTSLFRSRFTPRVLKIINLVCGAVICFYGAKLAWSFFQLI